MSLLSRWFGKQPSQSILLLVECLLDAPPDPTLATAIASTANQVTDRLLGARLKPFRPQLILAFARQSADAAVRLSSSHWVSDNGRNVGLDVLEAHDRALTLFTQALTYRPRLKRPLHEVVMALDGLIETWRNGPGDVDGYGLGTLHEIRRDLARLSDSTGF